MHPLFAFILSPNQACANRLPSSCRASGAHGQGDARSIGGGRIRRVAEAARFHSPSGSTWAAEPPAPLEPARGRATTATGSAPSPLGCRSTPVAMCCLHDWRGLPTGTGTADRESRPPSADGASTIITPPEARATSEWCPFATRGQRLRDRSSTGDSPSRGPAPPGRSSMSLSARPRGPRHRTRRHSCRGCPPVT